MDCFNGTGSTMVAVHKAGRNFVGAEMDRDYYDRSLERFATLTGARANVPSGEEHNI